MLLSANDRVIKLWKIESRKEKKFESCKKLLQKGKLVLPRSKVVNESVEGRCKNYFKGAHEYHINSINLSADGENFLSSDEVRINIWNLNSNNTVYNVLDIKPKNSNDIEEAINYTEFNR